MGNLGKEPWLKGMPKRRPVIHADGNEYDAFTGRFIGGMNPPKRTDKKLKTKRDLKGYEKW